MEKKRIALQIFTGGYLEDTPPFEKLRSVLEPLLCRMKVEKILMGWSVKPALYRETIRLAKHYGAEVYLWLPVLSETGLLKPVRRLIDDEGKEVQQIGLKGGEKFEFYCPNQELNTKSFWEIYEEFFSELPFDGVFLDKIRYGSFANGKGGVFSCFCPECRKVYAAAGIPEHALLAQMKSIRAGVQENEAAPLDVECYEAGRYRFRDPIWEKFFVCKQHCIYDFLKPVTDWLRSRGLRIGIDTFSPFTAYFAGQDTAKLAKLADFIKPMMYRITRAPAGLLWESEQLLQETLAHPSPAAFSRILGVENMSKSPFDLEFVKRELALLAAGGADIYAGIEINRIDPVAPATPEYIRENVRAFSETAIRGFVLAWDLLCAPEENLQEVLRLFGK